MIRQQTYEEGLEKLKNKENAYSKIAKILIDKRKNEIKVGRAIELAVECAVSNSMITKFAKELGFNNASEMAYVHNNFAKSIEWVNSDKSYEKAAQLITKARKVFLVGVSNSYTINQDFASKLLRLDKWVIFTPNKYEQVGLAKLLGPKDVLIVNSVSLQHTWMIDIMKNTSAKIILIASKPAQAIETELFFEISTDERTDPFRVYTAKNRIAAFEILDKIFYELYKKPENQVLMKVSSYK